MTNVEKLKRAREELGWTQARLAKELQLDRSYLSTLETGAREVQDWIIERLKVVLELHRRSVGKPTMAAGLMLKEESRGGFATTGQLRMVPVVSFARAGDDGFDYEDLGSHFDSWVPTTSTDPNAFALRVEGDSMESRYSAGDILVINPNEEPRNGDLVVARLEKSGGVLFKLYHVVGDGRVRLTSYNKDMYPPLEFSREEFRFIYPIVNVMYNPRGR